jgi:6-phosphogluconolactonase (cycloisomerase 2 family)
MPPLVTGGRPLGIVQARGRRISIALVTIAILLGSGLTASGVFAEDSPHSPGALAQLDLPFGCWVQRTDNPDWSCKHSRTLDDVRRMDISPNGRFVYVSTDHVLGIFMRDPVTGQLSQADGLTGCLSLDGRDKYGGLCSAPTDFDSPWAVAISPDNKFAYVAGGTGITVYSVDQSTGALEQLPGPAGCINNDASNGCTQAFNVDDPTSLTVSPDSENVYLTASTDRMVRCGQSGTYPPTGATYPPCPSGAPVPNTIVSFRRNTTDGTLTQLSGDAKCVSEDGALDGCRPGRALFEVKDIAMAPDNKYAYAIVSEAVPRTYDYTRNVTVEYGAVTVLKRDDKTGDPATDGALSQIDCVGDPATTCGTPGRGLGDGLRLIVSPDSKTVYTAAQNSNSTGVISAFSRDLATGLLTQIQCISNNGMDSMNNPGACEDGRNLHEPSGLAMSRDPTVLYVANDGGPSLFSRDPATGRLEQLPGTDGCIRDRNDDGTPVNDGCGTGYRTYETSAVVAPPGCDFVYFAGHDSNSAGGSDYARDGSISIFQRNTDCTPVSAASVPAACSNTGGIPVTVTDRAGLAGAKKVRYKLDGGSEQVVATTAGVTGTATINVPEGKHVLEYWGEDQDAVLEKPAPLKSFPPHRVELLVDKTSPTVAVTSDQKKASYRQGETATITVTAGDTGGALATDPSGVQQRLSTNTVGKFTVARAATDACGNTTSASFVYTVTKAAVKRLSLGVSPKVADAGRETTFTFLVRSAGKAIGGATVKFGGKTATTNGRGRATITVTLSKAGLSKATASKKGYRSASKRLRAR